ncbi:MAG: DNA-3-methyladenine glycosylase [Gemmatimonadetes bacterium]|nr:DNA-3-methyladenine glycosylase [Gemmatimonadota bacterium]
MPPRGSRRSVHSAPPASALPVSFYDRGADEVARDLLGCMLVSEIDGQRVVGEIVETEAYVGADDEASHGHRRFGVTRRNAVMYGRPGITYVYRIYGMHWCVNAVTSTEGYPAAVLIRAARPIDGMDAARARRPGRPDRDLMRGPANLCRAMSIDGHHNEHPLASPPLWIGPGVAIPDDRISRGPRVGISRAVDDPLRFWIRGSEWVSGRVPREPSTEPVPS